MTPDVQDDVRAILRADAEDLDPRAADRVLGSLERLRTNVRRRRRRSQVLGALALVAGSVAVLIGVLIGVRMGVGPVHAGRSPDDTATHPTDQVHALPPIMIDADNQEVFRPDPSPEATIRTLGLLPLERVYATYEAPGASQPDDVTVSLGRLSGMGIGSDVLVYALREPTCGPVMVAPDLTGPTVAGPPPTAGPPASAPHTQCTQWSFYDAQSGVLIDETWTGQN